MNEQCEVPTRGDPKARTYGGLAAGIVVTILAVGSLWAFAVAWGDARLMWSFVVNAIGPAAVAYLLLRRRVLFMSSYSLGYRHGRRDAQRALIELSLIDEALEDGLDDPDED